MRNNPHPLPTEDLAHILTHTREVFATLHDARLFITGGTGFFGHWLLESLLYANRELALNIHATILTRNAAAFQTKAPHIAGDAAVTLLEGDVRTFAFPPHPHTHIIHAATDTIPTHVPLSELADSILEGTRRVLQFAHAAGARRLLYTSSGAVYGRGITDVARISETYPSAPLPPNSYDDAKRQAEQLCIAAPIDCSIARCFAFVGPHLPLDQHFAIGNFIGDALSGNPIHIKGDGTPLRSFLYMSDLAIWLWTMLTTAPANRPYNVGSDEAVSIAELAHLVREIVIPSAEIALPNKEIASPSAAKDLLLPGSAKTPGGSSFVASSQRVGYRAGRDRSLQPASEPSSQPDPVANSSSQPERGAAETLAGPTAAGPSTITIQIDGIPNPGAPPATYVPDITRAQTELGLRVTIPLSEAIRRTAAWHR